MRRIAAEAVEWQRLGVKQLPGSASELTVSVCLYIVSYQGSRTSLVEILGCLEMSLNFKTLTESFQLYVKMRRMS